MGCTIVRFFDNLQVTHTRGPLLEEDHYFPFGLTMAGISDKAIKPDYAENKYRFIGQLFDDDLDWDTYEMKYRTMDPQLERFWQIDPLAKKYVYNSTYAYAENRVINGIDLEGAEYFNITTSEGATIGHAVNPHTVTEQAVKAAEATDKAANQINARVGALIGIGVVGFLDPAVGVSLALSYLTGLPVTPSPQALEGALAGQGLAELESDLPATSSGAPSLAPTESATPMTDAFSMRASPDETITLHPQALEKGYQVPVDASGGVDMSNYLIPVTGDQKNVVKIKMTGSYLGDFKAANQAAGFAEQPANSTWHHFRDFNPATNETTMQLSQRAAHRAATPHRGSVAQYKAHHGTGY